MSFKSLSLLCALAAASLALLSPSTSEARSFRVAQMPGGTCDTCHVVPGGPRNLLGQQIEATLPDPVASQNVDWQDFFALDADQDGYTNGQELGDPEGDWMIGQGDPGALSDPSDAGSTPDGQEPRCTPGAELFCNGVDDNCDGRVDDDLNCPSPSLTSFSFDQASVAADGMEVQTLRLTLADAGLVDDVRFLINRPGHAENGRGYSGYFRLTPMACIELGTGLGNADVNLDTGTCEINVNEITGSVEFVVRFTVESSYGAATNNHVSAIWYVGGVMQTGWRKVTTPAAGFDVTGGDGPPPSFDSFSVGVPSVPNDAQTVQTFRLILANGAPVDEVRFLMNKSGHAENGRTNTGYFRVRTASCNEITSGLGNADIGLQTGTCERIVNPDSTVEFVARFVVNPSFAPVTNNAVSVIWYSEGLPLTSWRKVSVPGNGFDVTDAGPQTPALESFTYSNASVNNDGAEIQTLTLRISGGASVDEARVIVNRAGQTENGREYSGYFGLDSGGCSEVTSNLGNDTVTLLTGSCQRIANEDGSVDFVFPYTVDGTFVPITNNHVSAIWYTEGTPLTGWTKVTQTGMGFDITQAPTPDPVYMGFAMDETTVANDGVEVQTLRLTIANGSPVDEARFLINRPGHVENGRSYSGYFRVTDALCEEASGGLGNADVEIVAEGCERNDVGGVVEFVVRFVVEDTFVPVDNNSVSAIWYVGGVPQTGWRKVTSTGEGFDVTLPTAPEPSFSSFSFDAQSVANDGVEVQTFRLTLDNADGVIDDVRFIINRPGHVENGRGYSGYFSITPEGCTEFGGGLGNADVEIVPEMCASNVGQDGTVEYVVTFVVLGSYGTEDNNSVSAIWYEEGSPLVSWQKVSTVGEGFDIIE
jgi:hypothetical protein